MKPTTVFISYAYEDMLFFKQLQTHLTHLKRKGIVQTWHDGMIVAGDDWRSKVQRELDAADMLLLLASPDFLASEYLYSEHLTRAIDRHERGEMRVIPIIIRECQWTETALGKLRPLPMTGEPMKKWADPDEFWKTIAVGIREALSQPPEPKPVASVEPTHSPPSQSLEYTTSVRRAYRLLHQYHAQLFDIFRQVLHASSTRTGTLNAAGWGSSLFDLPIRRDRSPIDKWVNDFIPLEHGYLWWATAKKPTPGATLLMIQHCGDDAIETARAGTPDAEPDIRKLAPAETARSTLDFYIETVMRLDPAQQVLDWSQVDVLIERTRGFDATTWKDGRVHEVATSAWTVRYAGLSRNMSELQTRGDVERLVVQHLLPLIDEARAP